MLLVEFYFDGNVKKNYIEDNGIGGNNSCIFYFDYFFKIKF